MTMTMTRDDDDDDDDDDDEGRGTIQNSPYHMNCHKRVNGALSGEEVGDVVLEVVEDADGAILEPRHEEEEQDRAGGE